MGYIHLNTHTAENVIYRYYNLLLSRVNTEVAQIFLLYFYIFFRIYAIYS